MGRDPRGSGVVRPKGDKKVVDLDVRPVAVDNDKLRGGGL